MDEAAALITEADRRFAEDDASAGALYRAAILLTPPPEHVWENLTVAEDEERIQFRQMVRQKYPSNLSVRISQIIVLLHLGHQCNTQVVYYCTQLLNDIPLDRREELQVRRWRLLGATRWIYSSPIYQWVHEDFITLWMANNESEGPNPSQYYLLQQIMRVNDPNTIPSLTTISEDIHMPVYAQKLLTAKIQELNILKDINLNITRPESGNYVADIQLFGHWHTDID